MKYKKLANKTSSGLKAGTNILKVANPAYKYRKEIAIATKGAKFAAKHSGAIRKEVGLAQKYAAGGNISIPGALVNATLGIAKRQGEKYLDKKLGKYKSYRIAKAGLDTVYDVATGNPIAAINHATNLYSEIDPNKKRADRIAGGIHGATAVASGVMSGNVLRTAEGGMQMYSAVDPNRKRAAEVNKINEDYISPTANLVQNANKANTQIKKTHFIFYFIY